MNNAVTEFGFSKTMPGQRCKQIVLTEEERAEILARPLNDPDRINLKARENYFKRKEKRLAELGPLTTTYGQKGTQTVLTEEERAEILARPSSDPERIKLKVQEAYRRRKQKIMTDPQEYEKHLKKMREGRERAKERNAKLDQYVSVKKDEVYVSRTNLILEKCEKALENFHIEEIPEEETMSLCDAAKLLKLDVADLLRQSLAGAAPPHIVEERNPGIRYRIEQIQQFKESKTWET